MPKKVKEIQQYNDKLFVFSTDDNTLGIMNMDGEVVVRAKYKDLAILDNKTFIAKSDSDKWYIVNDKDERGKELEDVRDVVPAIAFFELAYGLSSGFELIVNEGENEYKLYKQSGEPLDKKDYYDIETFAINTRVVSDYFDAVSAAKKLVGYIDENGYDKVQLGQPLYKYINGGNPKNYTGTDKYYFNNLEGGYKYKISGFAYTNSYVARTEARYRTETYGYYYTYSYQVFDHYDYYWNKDAIVNFINVDMDINMNDQFDNVKVAIVKELKSKGYSVEKDEKPYSILKNKKNYIFLSLESASSNSNLSMRIYMPDDWAKNRESLVDRAISNYKEAKSIDIDEKVANPVFDEIEDVVEIVQDSIVADVPVPAVEVAE